MFVGRDPHDARLEVSRGILGGVNLRQHGFYGYRRVPCLDPRKDSARGIAGVLRCLRRRPIMNGWHNLGMADECPHRCAQIDERELAGGKCALEPLLGIDAPHPDPQKRSGLFAER